jgi:regulatory protein
MRKNSTRVARLLDSGGLWELSLKLLGARARTMGELRAKLGLRAAVPQDVETTIARLKDCGYLDDRRFAESFTEARLQDQGLGKRRVIQELRKHRVAPALAETTVRKTYETVDEVGLIESYIRRRFHRSGDGALFANERDLASAYRRLLRAGFGGGNIIRVLKRFAANPELVDQFDEEPQNEGDE